MYLYNDAFLMRDKTLKMELKSAENIHDGNLHDGILLWR